MEKFENKLDPIKNLNKRKKPASPQSKWANTKTN
jgi:hypothetical protein